MSSSPDTNQAPSPSNATPQLVTSKDSKKLPQWMPIALAAGSTIVLGLPLLFLFRRQRNALRKALDQSSSPPPRRSIATSRLAAISPTAGRASYTQPKSTEPAESLRTDDKKDDFSMPGIGELVGAIGSGDKSAAMLGAKAFAIATCIVGAGAFFTVAGVKLVTGVKDAQEFGQLMRQAMWKTFPRFTSSVHREPEAEEELAGLSGEILRGAVVENWTIEDAEKRLRVAYEKGGLTAWQELAVKELEIEVAVERERRRKEAQS